MPSKVKTCLICGTRYERVLPSGEKQRCPNQAQHTQIGQQAADQEQDDYPSEVATSEHSQHIGFHGLCKHCQENAGVQQDDYPSEEELNTLPIPARIQACRRVKLTTQQEARIVNDANEIHRDTTPLGPGDYELVDMDSNERGDSIFITDGQTEWVLFDPNMTEVEVYWP